MQRDSFDAMMAEVAAFHHKHGFDQHGGEDMVYRVALMAEELAKYPPAYPRAGRFPIWPRSARIY